MKSIVFDTGPLISLTLNSLLWVVEEMKKKYDGKFIIPESVKKELIENPLQTKKFKLEALQALPLFDNKTFELFDSKELDEKTKEMLEIANNTFVAKGQPIKCIHYADMQVLVAAKLLNADVVVIDEYTTRFLAEDTDKIVDRFKRKLHTKIRVDKDNVKKIKEFSKGLKVIRSTELITIAYEMGILDKYLFEGETEYVNNPKRELLHGSLWALKLHGCGISEKDIKDIMNLEQKRNMF